jgi:calcineurin-like phosphoesterase family protein
MAYIEVDTNGTIRHYDDNGLVHREDGPAVIRSNGKKSWFKHGKLHREDGPTLEDHNGNIWIQNEVYHREDGPAIDLKNNKRWIVHGKLHRLDGPAFVNVTHTDWYINGFLVTDLIQSWAKEREIDLDNLTEEDKIIIALEWSNYSQD